MGSRGQFVEFQRSRVTQRTQVGKESLLIVGPAGRPHSLRLQLGTLPAGHARAQALFRARIS
jgi:hypothetical protein